MSGVNWRIEDPEPNPTPPGVVQGSWMSLHYLRSALQRKWRLVAATTAAGLMLAVAALFLLPQSATASGSVLLAHDPSDDPLTAIQLDESLLGTRTVSDEVVKQLGLPMSAESFRSTFNVSQASTQLLEITLKAPTNQEAVTRLNTLASAFLTFRDKNISGQADAVVTAKTEQIAKLQSQTDDLTHKYNDAVAAGEGELAQGYLTQKSAILSQITTLQQEIRDTSLQAESLSRASHVVDSAAPVPPAGKKRVVLGVMSGLILGGAVGVGLVFVHALLSNSLRRREDVATALGRPVSFSAGAVRGFFPWRHKRRLRNLEVLATGLLTALPEERTERDSLGVLGVGDLRSAATVVVAAARELRGSGDRVFLVDLTEGGWLGHARHRDFTVYRPEERAHLTDGPLSLAASADSGPPEGDLRRQEWDEADVVLVLGEAELGVGTGHLSTWTERVVVLVGAGKATAELLRSISRMLTRSGPELEFGMLVGADWTDDSLGVARRVAQDEQQRRAR